MKILIVDDSITARVALKKVISSVEPSAEFFEAEDGAEGLDIFKKETPRVVFTDLTMPIVDGYETLTQILKIDSETQVIIVTADSQPEAKELVLMLGAKNLYTKPISVEKMKNIFLHDLLV